MWDDHILISRVVYHNSLCMTSLSCEMQTGPVREYIEMLCKNEQLKFLVFAYHHDMMDSVQQTLYEKKVKFVRIDGSTKSSDRQVRTSVQSHDFPYYELFKWF